MTVMATEYGIWSEAAGGFIETQLHSPRAGAEARDALVEDGEERSDLKVLEICPDHEDQPKATCEECFAEVPEMCDEHPDQPADDCKEC
jgi:hypothetical protein